MLRTEERQTIQVGNETFDIYLSYSKIQDRIHEVAEQINKDYEGKSPVFVCTLNGAFMFMTDLMKNITVECEVDFMKLSSYGDAKLSSGNVKLLKSLDCPVTGQDIIIVEDIVDTGLSLKYMKDMLLALKPASLKFVSLLVKKEAIKHEVQIDYSCFEIPNKFVIGYGLDLEQKYRNLPSIYTLRKA